MERELEQLRQDYDRKLITRHRVRELIATYPSPPGLLVETLGIALGMRFCLKCSLFLCQILTEMCTELKGSLERYKIAMTTETNSISFTYHQSQCQAMLGKLE